MAAGAGGGGAAQRRRRRRGAGQDKRAERRALLLACLVVLGGLQGPQLALAQALGAGSAPDRSRPGGRGGSGEAAR